MSLPFLTRCQAKKFRHRKRHETRASVRHSDEIFGRILVNQDKYTFKRRVAIRRRDGRPNIEKTHGRAELLNQSPNSSDKVTKKTLKKVTDKTKGEKNWPKVKKKIK